MWSAEKIMSVKDEVIDKLSSLQIPNRRSAENALIQLRDAGYHPSDISDARDALSEYTEMVREDYESGPDGQEDYSSDRADAWQNFLDYLNTIPEPGEEEEEEESEHGSHIPLTSEAMHDLEVRTAKLEERTTAIEKKRAEKK